MQDITNEIKEILMNKDEKINIVHQKRRAVINEMAALERNVLDEEYIRIASMPRKNVEYYSVGLLRDDRDLYHILVESKEQIKERKTVLRTMLWRLADEEDMINRIWVCFMSLEGLEFSILNQLYVEKKPYKQVENESGLSHMPFEQKRKNAILHIRQKYLSNKTLIDIFNVSKRMKQEI
ncbi:MAG: hypothetical protein MR871_04890 [Lachnospiraceae bacterium]|nr:hypothetical protein [Lachnospiraceae bacterium]MDY3747106.1 hypothetical protein [Lachnospiraceae bacterium]